MAQGTLKNTLVTGATGLVGSQVLVQMAQKRELFGEIVALDIRRPSEDRRLQGVTYLEGDICDPELAGIFAAHQIDVVVHLAAILAPGKNSPPGLEYKVDVGGTKNVLRACIASGVAHYIGLSSGAAYGYHADNPVPLHEDDPLRGNDAFAYSKHKRLVEEVCEHYRKDHPELRQLIFRPGTILGAQVKSPVSALFERAVVMGIAGFDSPFVLIWDEDVAAAIIKGILDEGQGQFNLAGDGAMSLRQIAERVGKIYVPVPASLLAAVLWFLHRIGLSERGPEGVDFLRYRPVLSNQKLKTEFGFEPAYTSSEVFDRYMRHMSEVRVQ